MCITPKLICIIWALILATLLQLKAPVFFDQDDRHNFMSITPIATCFIWAVILLTVLHLNPPVFFDQ